MKTASSMYIAEHYLPVHRTQVDEVTVFKKYAVPDNSLRRIVPGAVDSTRQQTLYRCL